MLDRDRHKKEGGVALSKKDIQQLNTQFQRVIDSTEQTVREATKDIPKIKEDIGELKNDVGMLKKDVGELKKDVGVLKKDVCELKNDVGKINVSLGHVESEQGLQTVLLKSLQLNHEMVQDKLLHGNTPV